MDELKSIRKGKRKERVDFKLKQQKCTNFNSRVKTHNKINRASRTYEVMTEDLTFVSLV